MSGAGEITEVILEPQAGRQVTVRLGERIGAAGSHGEVRRIIGPRYGTVIVKLSHNPRAQRTGERVRALMSDQRSWSANGMFRAAWPVARALAVTGHTDVGFAMPRLSGPSYLPMRVMFDPPAREKAFPGATWNRYLMLAADLARAVGSVHDRGYTIGDLCPENLFVTSAATVVMTDVDDWQTGRAGDPGVLPCRGSRSAYTPPEHLADAVGDGFRQPTSDQWALAVAIGEVLFIGRRPFEGFPPGADPSWDEPDNVSGRHCWLLSDNVRVAPGTPSRSLLPGRLRNLFEACFDAGYDCPSRRPPPQRWAEELDASLSELTTCDVVALHVYPRGTRQCPWCEAATAGRFDLFGGTGHHPPRGRPATAPRPPTRPPRAAQRPGGRPQASPARPAPSRPAQRKSVSNKASTWGAIAALVFIILSIVLLAVH